MIESFWSLYRSLCIFILANFFPAVVLAQSTAGIQGPDVKKGVGLLEYRFAAAPPSDGDDVGFSHRFDYSYGFTENFSFKGLANFNTLDTGDIELTFVRFEGVYQFLEKEKAGFDSALRLEVQIADDDDEPNEVTLGWTSDVAITPNISFRGFALASRQFGPESGPGVFLEFRTRTAYKWRPFLNFNLESFHVLQSTASFGTFDDTSLLLGPTLSGRLPYGIGYNAGVLAGVTQAANDVEFRLFLTKAF